MGNKLAIIGDLGKASKAASMIDDNFKKIELLQSIAWEYSKNGNMDEAISTLNRATQLVPEVEDPDQMSSASETIDRELIAIACRQVRSGNVGGALRTVKAFWKNGNSHFVVEEGLGYIAAAQAKGGALKDALDTVSMLKDPFLKVVSFYEILGEIASSADSTTSLRVLRAAFSAAEEITNDLTREVSFRKISIDLANLGDIQEGVNVANRLRNPGSRIDTLYNIVIIQASAGAKIKAIKSLLGLMPAIKGLSSSGERGNFYRKIAMIQTWMGDGQGALQWAFSLEDPYEVSYALVGMIEGLRNKLKGHLTNTTWKLEKWQKPEELGTQCAAPGNIPKMF